MRLSPALITGILSLDSGFFPTFQGGKRQGAMAKYLGCSVHLVGNQEIISIKSMLRRSNIATKNAATSSIV